MVLVGGLQLALSTLGLIGNTLSIVLLSRYFMIIMMMMMMMVMMMMIGNTLSREDLPSKTDELGCF